MKRILTTGLFLLFGLALALPAQAQMKIGYANVELIFSYMPDAKKVEKDLRTYEEKLMESLSVKQSYLENKIQEFQEKQASGGANPAELKTMKQDLIKLDEEIKQSAKDAETKLIRKQEELLGPVQNKIQKAIETVADREGYDYVLSSNAGGVSIMLYGPDEHNLTEKIVKELGIDISALKEAAEAEQNQLNIGGDPSGGGLD